jgi:hypothetical protein
MIRLKALKSRPRSDPAGCLASREYRPGSLASLESRPRGALGVAGIAAWQMSGPLEEGAGLAGADMPAQPGWRGEAGYRPSRVRRFTGPAGLESLSAQPGERHVGPFGALVRGPAGREPRPSRGGQTRPTREAAADRDTEKTAQPGEKKAQPGSKFRPSRDNAIIRPGLYIFRPRLN